MITAFFSTMQTSRQLSMALVLLSLFCEYAFSFKRSSLVVEIVINSQHCSVWRQRPFTCDLSRDRAVRRIRSDDVFDDHSACAGHPRSLAFTLCPSLSPGWREFGFVTVELVRF